MSRRPWFPSHASDSKIFAGSRSARSVGYMTPQPSAGLNEDIYFGTSHEENRPPIKYLTGHLVPLMMYSDQGLKATYITRRVEIFGLDITILLAPWGQTRMFIFNNDKSFRSNNMNVNSVYCIDYIHPKKWIIAKTLLRFSSKKSLFQPCCQVIDNELDKAKFENIFCEVAHKLLIDTITAGATTWKNHLYTLNPEGLTHKIHTKRSEKHIRARLSMNRDTIEEKMYNNTYIRVMNVRHPLDRLVSAYRDKFRDGKRRPEQRAWRELGNVTFTEFLKIVLNNKKLRRENVHWGNYYRTCSACELPYDYIMKVETHTEDLRYIFKMAGITEVDPGARRHATSINKTTSDHVYASDSSYLSYFEGVDHQLIKDIHYLFKEDYQLFGY
ncbi:unnamed protein product, partial [Meganyctiphanes norvegica]